VINVDFKHELYHRSNSGQAKMTDSANKLVLGLEVLAIAAFFLFVVDSSAVATEKPMLTIPLPPVELNLDPHKMDDWYSMAANLQLHRGLFRYTAGGDVTGDLAKDWKVSADGKTFTVNLEEGLTFSNGTPIKADDVVRSFARIFLVGSSIGADIDYIEGAKHVRDSKRLDHFGVRALNDHSVEFRLERRSGLFTKHLATPDCAILFLVKEDLGTYKPGPGTPTSGPYRIAESTKDHLRLSKWRKSSLDSDRPPETIIFDLSGRVAYDLALAGAADTLDHIQLDARQMQELSKVGWRPEVASTMWERFIVMNPKTLAEGVRRTLLEALDPDEVAAKLDGGFFFPAFGIVPTGLPGSLTRADVRELRKAPPKPLEQRVKVRLEFMQGSPASERVASVVKELAHKYGIDVELIPLTSVKDFLARKSAKDFELLMGMRGLDYPDGYSVLTYFKSAYEGNWFQIADPSIDQLLNELPSIMNPEERAQGYKDAQLRILRHYTVAPLLFGAPSSGYWGPRATKVPPHPMGLHFLPMESVEVASK
jgi:ABC-type transport system substrate-binding protein